MFRPAHLRTLWRTAHCEPASHMHPLTLPAGRMWRAGRRRRGLPAGQVPVVATRGGTMEFAIWAPRMLSVLRIMAALLFIEHGTQKFFDFPPPATPGSSLTALLVGQGFLELVGGFLLLIGFYTRIVAFILSGDMAVAYFMRHAPRSFFPLLNGGDLAVLFCFVFFYIFVAGGGVWSVDAHLSSRRGLAPAT